MFKMLGKYSYTLEKCWEQIKDDAKMLKIVKIVKGVLNFSKNIKLKVIKTYIKIMKIVRKIFIRIRIIF